MQSTRERFIVDQNVGHLARWLRFMGFDTIYYKGSKPLELLRIARREGRVILTRNSNLVEAGLDPRESGDASMEKIPILILQSQDLEDQIRQIFETIPLSSPPSPFSRFSLCNTLLQKIPKEKVRGRVPFHVFEVQEDFYYCSSCDKFYWQGTHFDRMMERIRKWQKE